MALHQLTTQIQAQTRTGNAVLTGVGRAAEAAEHPIELIRGDAQSVVRHHNPCPSAQSPSRSFRLNEATGFDLNSTTLRAVLDGVGEQIGQHLLQTLCVPLHQQRIAFWRKRCHDGMAFGGHVLSPHHASHQGSHLQWLTSQLQTVGLQTGGVQEVVSQRCQTVRCVEGVCRWRVPGDEALADAVRRELRADASTTDLRIQLEVLDGIVHLYGQVEDLEDVENAEAVEAAVPGVQEVVEALQVKGL